MSAKAANSQSILSDMQPSRAIVKLAIPATLALLAKAVAGIYASQPAADVLTILVCILSVPAMKRIASRNMQNSPTE